MKFTWFNLMPWPYLPDDFRETHRSVWVDIPSTLYDPRKGHHVYHTYLDQLEYAETLGFDGIGCNEHHQNGYGLMPSPNLIAATLARRTSRAAICVIGNSTATGSGLPGDARTTRRTGRPSRRSSVSRIRTRRRSDSTPSTASTSSTAACTSSRPSPIRRAIARWPP